MIKIKSKREIALMREAGIKLAELRELLAKLIKPGVSTGELNDIAEKFLLDNNLTSPFKNHNGFPASICTSVNEEVVHGIPKHSIILREGDIISIDLGINYQGYYADSAWTYPVGKISNELQQLLEVTEKALYEGLKLVKPGNHISDISNAIEQFIKPYGYGVVEDFTGHGIGTSLHEEPMIPNFGKPNKGPVIQPGMTFCVEPMINLGTKNVMILSDNWTTITTDKKHSAHFEHTIVVTEEGYEILTDKE